MGPGDEASVSEVLSGWAGLSRCRNAASANNFIFSKLDYVIASSVVVVWSYAVYITYLAVPLM